jgi:HEPN domain-containing protein
MTDPGVFADEVFGFHAQQAIEKTLKAWIALLGQEYPFVHDVDALLNRLGGAQGDDRK